MSAAIEILLADDSVLCRQRLRAVIEADGDLHIVGEVHSGAAVLPALTRLRPRVLLTDLQMPEGGGLAVVREVMAHHPLPILVISGENVGADVAFEAIRSGALEVGAKPAAGDRRAELTLRETLRRLAAVPVIRHPGPPPVTGPDPARLAPMSWPGVPPRAVGIGASAGGPAALAELLAELDPDRAPAILVAQHLPLGQTAGYARYLARHSSLEVVICRDHVPLQPSRIILPDDGQHLIVLDARAAGVTKPDAGTSLVPSVDLLLTSLAARLGRDAGGIILSGIGRDGAAGLAALKAAGGLTLAQEERSCAVYGMPRAAAPSAWQQLPPQQLAQLLTQPASRRFAGRRP